METEIDPNPTLAAHHSVQCAVCGASMSDADELALHLEGHAEKEAEGVESPAGPPRHKCTLCDDSFDTAEQVKGHIAAAHRM